MTDMIKQLMGEFGFLKEDADIERNVKDQISRAATKDEVDTVAFGLETDDGQIVKVYVKTDDAEKFEQEMAQMLGEIDDIEEALNELSKDIEIIDVEWPEETDAEGDDAEDADPEADDAADGETDGSEVMNSKVYSKKNQAKEKANEELSYGEELTADLLAEANHHSIANQLSTVNQHLIYQAILHLGVPELALDKSPYRSAILRGIKDTALELAHAPSMRSTLKTFIKQQALDDRSNKHDKDLADEPVVKDEPKLHDKAPKQMAKHMPKDEPVDLLPKKAPKDVPPKAVSKPAPKPAPKPVKEELNSDTTAGMFWEAVDGIFKLADGTDDKSYATRVMTTQQYKSLVARSSSRVVSRMTNGLRTKLALLEKAILAANGVDAAGAQPVTEAFTYVELGELLGKLLRVGDDPKASLADRIIMSQAFKRLLLEARSTFGSLSSNVKRLLQAVNVELDKLNLTEADMSFDEPKKDDAAAEEPAEETGEEEEPSTAAPAPAPAPVNLDATDSGIAFKSEGDSLHMSFPGGTLELSGESLERAMKALNNKQTMSVQLGTGKFATFSPRGSSAVVKLMGTDTKIQLAPPDISAFLDAGGQVLQGDADNAKGDKPDQE